MEKQEYIINYLKQFCFGLFQNIAGEEKRHERIDSGHVHHQPLHP